MLRSCIRVYVVGVLVVSSGSCGGKSEGSAGESVAPDSGSSAGDLCPMEFPSTLSMASSCCESAGGTVEQSCRYPDPCVAGEFVQVSCDRVSCVWRPDTDRCDFPYCGQPGNMAICAPDELCVITVVRGGLLWYPRCAPNPCGDQLVSSECAASICNGYQFDQVGDREVHCECLGCS
jgi:hypothetical protein